MKDPVRIGQVWADNYCGWLKRRGTVVAELHKGDKEAVRLHLVTDYEGRSIDKVVVVTVDNLRRTWKLGQGENK